MICISLKLKYAKCSVLLPLSYWNVSIINIQLRELVPQVSYANSFMHSHCIRPKVMCEKWVFCSCTVLNMRTTKLSCVTLFSIRYFNLSRFQLQCLLNVFFNWCTDTNSQFFTYLRLKLIFRFRSAFTLSNFFFCKWPKLTRSNRIAWNQLDPNTQIIFIG